MDRWNWSSQADGRAFRLVQVSPKPNKRLRAISMHRAIWEAHNGPIPAGYEVDHIDRISRVGSLFDNRLENLRLATRPQNARNVKCHKDTASGLKGAYKSKSKSKPWRSCIMVNGKYIDLGGYNTAEEAHAAYCKAAAELHGDFARFK